MVDADDVLRCAPAVACSLATLTMTIASETALATMTPATPRSEAPSARGTTVGGARMSARGTNVGEGHE